MTNKNSSFDSYDASKAYSKDTGEEESFLSIEKINDQYFTKDIEDEGQDPSKASHIFVPPGASLKEREMLKTILFCCNTKFFLNKENINYDDSDNLSKGVTDAKADIHKQLISGALSLKKLAQQDGTEKVSEPQYSHGDIEFESNIGSHTIVSEIQFKDDKNDYYVKIDENGYVKKCKKHQSKKSTVHGRQLPQDNQLTIMNGEFIDQVHAKGTYIIISKTQVENSKANQITIDICYNYENKNAPYESVGGGEAFRITLQQKEGKYTLNKIETGTMHDDNVQEDTLQEATKKDIQDIINDPQKGQSLRDTLKEEPELCNVLQEAEVISQEQYQSIINNTVKEQIHGELFIISKKPLEDELSRSQNERIQDDNYNNSQNTPNTKQLQSSKRKSNSNNISQQPPDAKQLQYKNTRSEDRDISERPPDTNVNTADVKHNYNFFCLKDTWIGKNKTTGKYGCCGCDCC